MRNHLLNHSEEAMEWNGIKFYIVTMTPQLATELLRGNNHNRSLRDVISNNYLTDMRSGAWIFAGDPVRIATDGTLLDGQHRLSSVAEMPNNWSTPMLVIDGLSRDTQLVMDQGRKRTPGQQLQLLGYRDANLVAAVARQLLLWNEGLYFRDRSEQARITAASIQNYVTMNPAVPVIVSNHSTKLRNSYMAPSVVGAFLARASMIDESDAEMFIDRLVDGVDLKSGSAILALRERNIRNRADRRSDTERDQLGLLIKAWNAHRSGARITKMQLPKGGAFTESTFPELSTKARTAVQAVA